MIKKLALIILLSVNILYANTLVYVAYTDKMTADKVDCLSKGIISNIRQPFQKTSQNLTNRNTNYYLLYVTPINKTEEDYYNQLVKDEKIYLHKKIILKTIQDIRRGGFDSYLDVELIQELPEDFNKGFEIIKSSK